MLEGMCIALCLEGDEKIDICPQGDLDKEGYSYIY
jgi:hypothetical protein